MTEQDSYCMIFRFFTARRYCAAVLAFRITPSSPYAHHWQLARRRSQFSKFFGDWPFNGSMEKVRI